jgi:dihydroorotate dehydrogenase electron transfer subunit
MSAGFIPFRLSATRSLNERAKLLTFDRPVSGHPGQFVMAWLPGVGEKPFSIARLDPLSLLVVAVGPFSRALHALEPGESLWIKGPLGQGFSLAGKHILLAGGGYGAAPLLALARSARAAGIRVTACLGARQAEDLLLLDAFEGLGCDLSLSTEDGSVGEKGLITAPVTHCLEMAAVDGLFACGPSGMLSALAGLSREQRMPYQLSWEAHMRCGMGLCGSCEVPQQLDPALPVGWLACYDGPVFRKSWPDPSA